MAVELRELVIKTTIRQEGKKQAAAMQPPPSGNDEGIHEIIKQCVEKVLEIIKDKNGR